MLTRQSLDLLTREILSHLAACPDLIEAMTAETGIEPSDLRALAQDGSVGFAAALVDFITATDDRLLAFCTAFGRNPAEIERIRQTLEAGRLG